MTAPQTGRGRRPPRVSGHTTYRSVIPTEEMPEDLRWNAATLWAGPKCHIVHDPLSGWKVFNLVVTYHNDAPEPVAGKAVGDEEVQKGFQHVHPKAQEIIRHGRDWKLWVLCDRNPVERWVGGRGALLGDAAHPMLQYFAQGPAGRWRTPSVWRTWWTPRDVRQPGLALWRNRAQLGRRRFGRRGRARHASSRRLSEAGASWRRDPGHEASY